MRINDFGGRAMNIVNICKIGISIGLLAASATVQAQTPDDRANIERAALNYLEGFYEGSTEKLRQSVHPDAQKFGFYKENGTYHRVPMSFEGMLEFAEEVKANKDYPDENAPKRVEILDALDQTAIAKVYAWWGSDYMTLAKYDGKWMIVQVLWQTPPDK